MDETIKALKKSLKANKRVADGTVVRFKKFGGDYTYIGLYVNTIWWLTGTNTRTMTYDGFITFLGDAEDIEVATKWESLS